MACMISHRESVRSESRSGYHIPEDRHGTKSWPVRSPSDRWSCCDFPSPGLECWTPTIAYGVFHVRRCWDLAAAVECSVRDGDLKQSRKDLPDDLPWASKCLARASFCGSFHNTQIDNSQEQRPSIESDESLFLFILQIVLTICCMTACAILVKSPKIGLFPGFTVQ